MLRQQHSLEREKIIANGLSAFVNEMRLVDPVDLAAFLRLDLVANLSDIVNSAAELHFAPGFLTMGQGGNVSGGWSDPLEICLDLVMQPAGAKVHFTLRLQADTAEIRLAYISFDNPSDNPADNTLFLRNAVAKYTISSARIMPGKGSSPCASPLDPIVDRGT